jgi:hypothetical protein
MIMSNRSKLNVRIAVAAVDSEAVVNAGIGSCGITVGYDFK